RTRTNSAQVGIVLRVFLVVEIILERGAGQIGDVEASGHRDAQWQIVFVKSQRPKVAIRVEFQEALPARGVAGGQSECLGSQPGAAVVEVNLDVDRAGTTEWADASAGAIGDIDGEAVQLRPDSDLPGCVVQGDEVPALVARQRRDRLDPATMRT